jgi:hypothetical protein
MNSTVKKMYRTTFLLSGFTSLVMFLSPILQKASDGGLEPLLASIFWIVSFVFLFRHWKKQHATKKLAERKEAERWNSLSESEKQTEILLGMRSEGLVAFSGQLILGFFHGTICLIIYLFSIALPAAILERII